MHPEIGNTQGLHFEEEMSKYLRTYQRLGWAKRFGQRYADEHNSLVRLDVHEGRIEVWDTGPMPQIEVIVYKGGNPYVESSLIKRVSSPSRRFAAMTTS